MNMDLTMILELLFIFSARVIDVTLGTIRMIFIIRGDRVPAAAIGFVEIMVYTTALGMVIGSLDNPVKLVIFCAGFAMGVLSGSIIEEKLALGYRGIQVTIDAEEFGLHQHPDHGAHTKGQHQIKRGMHRVFSGNGFKRAKQHNGRQHIKQNQGKRHYPAP